jgi:hypothetical protein
MNGVVRRKLDPDSLFTGLVLVAAGIAFLTGDFGHVIRHWWPMLVVLVGIPKLFRLKTLWSGLWLIAIGAWLQLVQLHAFGLSYHNSWPLLLIVVGAGIALRAVFDVTGRERDEPA